LADVAKVVSDVADPKSALQDAFNFWNTPFQAFGKLADKMEASYKKHVEDTIKMQKQRKAAAARAFTERPEYREDGNEALMHIEL